MANYGEFLHDGLFWQAIRQTFLYMAVSIPLGLVLSFGLALLLNTRMRGIGIFRTLVYFPAVVPLAATAIVFQLIFSRDDGLLNAVLAHFGGPMVSWLNTNWAFIALIIMGLWGAGGGMIIFLAGLQGIPVELREAAQVDGAGPFRSLLTITIPLLTPVIFFMLVMAVIGALQVYVQPLLLIPVGPAEMGVGAGGAGGFDPTSAMLDPPV